MYVIKETKKIIFKYIQIVNIKQRKKEKKTFMYLDIVYVRTHGLFETT